MLKQSTKTVLNALCMACLWGRMEFIFSFPLWGRDDVDTAGKQVEFGLKAVNAMVDDVSSVDTMAEARQAIPEQ